MLFQVILTIKNASFGRPVLAGNMVVERDVLSRSVCLVAIGTDIFICRSICCDWGEGRADVALEWQMHR